MGTSICFIEFSFPIICKILSTLFYKQSNSFSKAHMIFTSTWFSCSHTHCLRRFYHVRAVAVWEYHYPDKKVMAVILLRITYKGLIEIARCLSRSWRISSSALFLSKLLRLLYFVVQQHWLISLFNFTC